ncbi:MAG: tetratricopeptide repeat protein [Bdellovibrionales bacterium]|nr:tetratricopeptide repeat protein [Bdellovibrionales bacterium]
MRLLSLTILVFSFPVLGFEDAGVELLKLNKFYASFKKHHDKQHAGSISTRQDFFVEFDFLPTDSLASKSLMEPFSSTNSFDEERLSLEEIKKKNSSGNINNLSPETLYKLGYRQFRMNVSPDVTKMLLEAIPPNENAPWYAKGQYILGVSALKQNKFQEAKHYFSKSNQTSQYDPELRKLSSAALARLAFHESDFERASDIYSTITKESRYDESILHELSWTHLKLNDVDLAYADLYLMFALFPESSELLHTARILSEIFARQSNLNEGSSVLERLSLRFDIESENTESAFRAFKDNEQELIFDLYPQIKYSPARAFLPPLAQNTLRRDATMKSLAKVFHDLEYEKITLEANSVLVREARDLWAQKPELSIDSYTILSWTNDIEAHVLGKSQESSKYVNLKSKRLDTTIHSILEDLDQQKETLSQIDTYLNDKWLLLSGERVAIAMLIKQNTRQMLKDISQLRNTAYSIKVKLDFKTLIDKFNHENIRSQQLSKYREKASLNPENNAILSRLDQIKKETFEWTTQKNLSLLRTLNQTILQIDSNLSQIAQTQRNLELKAKRLVANILPNIRNQITNNLNQYHWSIAELRYQMFKKFEAKIATLRRQNALHQLSFQMNTEPKEPQHVSHITGSTIDDPFFTSYLKASKEYIKDLHDQSEELLLDQEHLVTSFISNQESQWQIDKSVLREKAILAFKNYVRQASNDQKTPYALFRLAQLYLDRTRSDSPDKEQKLKLAVSALEQIKSKFPNYKHSDKSLYLLGSYYSQQGDLEKAYDTFLEIDSLYPNSTLIYDVRFRIGEHLFRKRRFENGLRYYRFVANGGSEQMKSKALYKIAWSQYLIGKYDEAIGSFSELLRLAHSTNAEIARIYSAYSDEASEYISFSLYRQKALDNPQRVLETVGVQDYTEGIFLKTAEIYMDRGDFRNSATIYDIILKNFPNSKYIPDILEKHIKFIETYSANKLVLDEKSRATNLLKPNALWRQANRENIDQLRKADLLASKWLFELAKQYESNQADQNLSIETYQQLIDQYPNSILAYEAQYRLAEMAFENGDYEKAALAFDLTVRNGSFSSHLEEALYNIVATRSAEIEHSETLKQNNSQRAQISEGVLDNFAYSVDNLITRAPGHEKAPEALYRSARLYQQSGFYGKSRTQYTKLVETFPSSQWNEPSQLALVQLHIDSDELDLARKQAQSVLQSNSTLTTETKTKLKELEKNSLFLLATKNESLGEFKQSQEMFLEFQNRYPESELASKALYNAIIMSRKLSDQQTEEQGLDILLSKYKTSQEARTAYLDRASFYISIYEIDKAIEAYNNALNSGSLKSEQQMDIFSLLAKLIPLSPTLSEPTKQLKQLSLKAPRSALPNILFSEVELDIKSGELALAKLSLSKILTLPISNSEKSMALAQLASISWKMSQSTQASQQLAMAEALYKKLPKNRKVDVLHRLAEAYFENIHQQQNIFSSLKLSARNPDTLGRSFQKKAKHLDTLEKTVFKLLKYPSPIFQMKGLDLLSKSYKSFASELLSLKLPSSVGEKERSDFSLSMKSMADPLFEKSTQTLAKISEITKETSLSAKSFEIQWPDVYLPSLPPLLAYQAESLGAPNKQTADFFNRGIEALKVPWSLSHRQTALNAFNSALLLSPNSLSAVYNRAIVYLLNNKLDDFNRDSEALTSKISEQTLIMLAILRSYLKKDYEHALRLSRKVNSSSTFVAFTRHIEILSLIMLKRETNALEVTKSLIRNQSNDPFTHRLLAEIYRRLGHFDLARFILNDARQKFPDNLNILSDYAILLESPDQKVLQPGLLEESKSNGHPENLARLALLYAEVGDANKGNSTMKMAIENGGNFHPTIMLIEQYLEKLAKAQKQ